MIFNGSFFPRNLRLRVWLTEKNACFERNGFFNFSVCFSLQTSRVSSALWEFTLSLMSNYGSLHLELKNLEFFSVNEIRIWLLESKNLDFFRWMKYAVWVNLKNSRFFDERSQICLSEPKKLKIFWWEMQTAIIANQWIGKFSQ